MQAFVAFLALVWLVNNPWVLTFLGIVILAALAFCACRFWRECLAVEPRRGPWSRVEPRFEWAKDQEAPHHSRARDDTDSKASDGEDRARRAAEAARAARIAELMDDNMRLEEQLGQLRKHIKRLEAEAADVPTRIREAANSGRKEVLHAFGYRRDQFEAMLRAFKRKEQAHAQRERSRREEQQRKEKMHREDEARKRREQSQRRSSSSKPWWEVLGVSPEASEEEVRRVYRGLARKFHPDNRVTGDAARMTEINAAKDEAMRRFAKAA